MRAAKSAVDARERSPATSLPTISREHAFVGPVVNVFLHEASHALFRLLKIPLLGQEEDAADQLAAYFVLQFPKERKRGLILGYAYVFASELKVRRPRDLNRPRVQLGRHVMFADVHDTPAQRLYSLLCLAYGSDKELFADVVEKGFLPRLGAVGDLRGRVSASRLCLPHAGRASCAQRPIAQAFDLVDRPIGTYCRSSARSQR